MSKIKEFLQELDLNDKETEVYLKLLELGKQAVSTIAKKLKKPRSSTLFHLNRLVEKGFAIKNATIGKTSYFSPIKPPDIRNLLQHKKDQIDYQLETLENITPALNKLFNSFIPESQVSYFQGIEGIFKMVDLMLEKDIPLHMISAHDLHPKIRNYIEKVYVPARQRMKSKCQMIVAKKREVEDYLTHALDVYEWIGYAISKSHKLQATIIIYDNKIQFQSCNGENIGGVLIENQYLANTMLAVFMLLKNTERVDVVKKP